MAIQRVCVVMLNSEVVVGLGCLEKTMSTPNVLRKLIVSYSNINPDNIFVKMKVFFLVPPNYMLAIVLEKMND